MNAGKPNLIRGGLIAGLLGLIVGLGAGAPKIKLRVTVDNAPIKATMGISAQNVTAVPLDTILDAELKAGEWYKVTIVKDSVPLSGYIHEMLVKEITEAEAQQEMSPTGRGKSQAEVIAEIDLRLEEDRKLIRVTNEPDKALEDLRALLARAFDIEDRQKQKQTACDIYFWTGMACVKKNDNYGSVKEFKSMYDVNYAYGVEITKNISDPSVSGFLEHAEKLAKGLLVEYTLQITTRPKEATLKVNGKPIGVSPDIYRTPMPKFLLEVEKEGFKPIREDVFLSQAATVKEYALESIGRNVAVTSTPPGAKVFLDGADTGKVTDCELPIVPYGPHQVKLVRENHADWESPVRVTEGSGPIPLPAVLTVNTYAYYQKSGPPDSRFFQLPKAVAVDREGSFYIVDESDIKLKKFNAEARFMPFWGDSGRESRVLRVPAGVAVDGAGFIFVSDSRDCSILKFDNTGKFVKKWGEEGTNANELSNPTSLAVDAAGDLYVADTNNNRIVKYSPDGVVKKAWGGQGVRPGEFVLPTAVAVSAKNELLVIDRSRLQKFTLDGAPIGSWGKPGSGDGEMKVPMGVCTDASNGVYIADTGNNRILKFDADGKLVCQWGTAGMADGQLKAPVGIAIIGQKNILIVERENHRFQEFRTPGK